MAGKHKTPGFLPKHMREAVVDYVGTLLEAAEDEQITSLDEIANFGDSDEGNVTEALGYVRACVELRGKNYSLVRYIREVAVENGLKIPEKIDD